ncbi:MAG: DUF4926 domain-containing protein [Actinobacteria bacterium]|nr:DUF4926 domain-containing protein [Actinomycetota bacterium]
MRIEEHDVVQLKDGREGTVVFVFSQPRTAYLVEVPLDDEWEQITVEPEKIDRVTWRARTHKPA